MMAVPAPLLRALSLTALPWIFSCGVEVGIAPTSDGAVCDVTIQSTSPADGADDAHYRGAIEFYLSEPDPSAVVLSDVPGVQSLSGDRRIVRFTPDAPLDPLTDYTFALDYCHGTPEIRFSTSELGLELSEPEALIGETYRLDIDAARYHKGGALASFLAGWVSGDVLLQVTDASDEQIDVRLAIAEDTAEAHQDFCFRTLDVDGISLTRSQGLVDFWDEQMSFGFYEDELSLYGTALQFNVAPDLSWVGGGALELTIDVRDLVASLDLPEPEGLCEIVEDTDYACAACLDDGAPFCIQMSADGIEGDRSGLELERVELRNGHPDCDKEI